MITKSRKMLWKKNDYYGGFSSLWKWSNSSICWNKALLNLLEMVEENHIAIQFQYKGKRSICLRGHKHMTCSRKLVQLGQLGSGSCLFLANWIPAEGPEQFLILREEIPNIFKAFNSDIHLLSTYYMPDTVLNVSHCSCTQRVNN